MIYVPKAKGLENDTNDFNLVYKTFYSTVHTYFKVKLHSGQQCHAEDLASKVWIKVHKALPNFDGKQAKISTWVLVIAKNVLFDFLRQHRNNPYIVSINMEVNDKSKDNSEMYINITDNVTTADNVMELVEQVEQVKALVREMRPIEQTAFRLFFLEQLTLKEIADEMDIPINTAKQHVFRVRKFVQSRMECDLV
jgi:RNA polymerase sigma-70 factor, ECF subfamily